MSEFDALCCPFRAEVIAAVPLRLAMLIHAAGAIALLMLLR